MSKAGVQSKIRLIGVGNGSRRPRPPNRACGSPAHGSPVGGFHIGIGLLTHRGRNYGEQPLCCKEDISYLPPMTPLSSAANMRSLHSEVSTHDRSRPCVSALCVVPSDTGSALLSLCLSVELTYPPSCLPSLGAALLSALLADSFPLRYHEGSDSCPAHLPRRSPRLPRHIFLSFRLQPRGLPGHRFTHHASVPSEFRTSPWNRRLVAAPRRIEFVHLRTDSSPPVAPHPASRRRSYLRLRSLWHTPTRTFTVLM